VKARNRPVRKECGKAERKQLEMGRKKDTATRNRCFKAQSIQPRKQQVVERIADSGPYEEEKDT